MRFLIDTNICIALMNATARGKEPELRRRLGFLPLRELAICSIVVEELTFGALKSARPIENQSRVEKFMEFYECLPFDEFAAKTHAHLRVSLKKSGKPIGHNDLMIAAIAVSHRLTLVTRNTREFSQISEIQPGLELEEW